MTLHTSKFHFASMNIIVPHLADLAYYKVITRFGPPSRLPPVGTNDILLSSFPQETSNETRL